MQIGKLAKAVGCSIDTIRFYEQKGLLPKPARSAGNFRLYDNQHLQRLAFICYCRSLDLSLDEIKQLLSLEQNPQQQNQQVADLLDQHIRDINTRIHHLQHLRMDLQQLKEKCGVDASQSFMQMLQNRSLKFRPIK